MQKRRDMLRAAGLGGIFAIGGIMRGTGGTPPRPAGYQEPSLPGVAPGSTSGIFRGRLVIIGAGGPGTGEFVYDTATPQANHLIASDVGAATLDTVGNYALPGRTSYRNIGGGVFMATNLNPSAVTFGPGVMVGFYSAATQQGPANPWTFQSGVNANNAGTVWLGTARGDVLQLDSTGTVSLIPFAGQGKYIAQNGTGTLQLQCDASGIPEVVNGNDLGLYALGQSMHILGSNTSINSTTPITLVTFNNVAPGYYRVQGRLHFTSPGAGTVQPMSMRLGGTVTCDNVTIDTNITQYPLANAAQQPGNISAINSDPTNSPNLGLSATYRWEFEGIIHVTVAGSLLLTGRQGLSAADEVFTALDHTWMEIRPVV